MVKETVDKPEKPETVTTHNNETTAPSYREGCRGDRNGGDKGNFTKWLKPASLDVILKLNPSILQASGTDSWCLEWTGRLGPPSLGSHVTLLSKGSFLQR